MLDNYIKDQTKSIADGLITGAIRRIKCNGRDGMPMVIGIGNERKMLYRKIVVYGFGNYLTLTRELGKIGFYNLIADNPGVKGFDSLFLLKI